MNTTIAAPSPKAAELRSVLMILDQIDKADSAADAFKVGQLPFWTRTKPQKLAGELDRVFVRVRRARQVAEGPRLIEILLDVARKEGRNMLWLGERLVAIYGLSPQCRLRRHVIAQ